MGIQVKHVCVVSTIFAVMGFGYVVGFAEIDAVSSPRAGALRARPSLNRLVRNVRGGMARGQEAIARAAGDDLIRLYPKDARSWLNRGYAYRMGEGGVEMGVEGDVEGVEGIAEREGWEQLLMMMEGQDFDSLRGTRLGSALYYRGWALRGVGRLEESRADFERLVGLYERSAGVSGGGGVDETVGGLVAYNMACYLAGSGDFERALGYFAVSVEGGYDLSIGEGWWRVDPDFEDLRGDDRFWLIGEGAGGDGG